MLAVEEMVRGFCVRELDPLVGESGFDFIADLGAMMPMRTIGYLLGIPEADQEKIRDRSVANIEMSKDSDPAAVDASVFATTIALFAEYIEWRADHPSDDLMTELLRAEIDEPDGTKRPLSRTEVLSYTAMIAGAGNETTARLIGFMGQLLSDHPDQRRELAADHVADPRRDRGDAALRTAVAGAGALRRARCRALRSRDSRGVVHAAAERLGQPRRKPVPGSGPLRHPPPAAPTSASGRACISAWARRWPGWRRGWLLKKS